ncbi:hypothetical protein ASPACDRAFT_1889724 [Aspergillus aculeatus ATCC 16872]|uniref:BZIP domain-containing protein n=1 Tax=Aspergillus aculeatus (strain ATCC 16872 / CBS 172.66 / WB 5094) TaxID=690307 RepID=A0A1L9WQZ3_ASPA1|nr:uncharacterized protein ASPACDRAFT_1889724 [Aspergillus aculeatus ATCC 16872]OJJ98576.1 hypothetical protein ASPACDRAFT_1889724 [Aspergillus aculeatus ATCC 16872]
MLTPKNLPADDWRGVSDAKERRRLQNRINQRAYRFKKRLQKGLIYPNGQWRPVQAKHQPRQSPRPIASKSTAPATVQDLVSDKDVNHALIPRSSAAGISKPYYSLSKSVDSRTGISNAELSRYMSSWAGKVSTQWLKLLDVHKKAILLHEVARFHHSYWLNSPCADHLLSLTRINVHRAFVHNMVVLGITWEWMQDDSISPFVMAQPGGCFKEDAVIPARLIPTSLQRRSIHHTWLDLFPCPIMRDNLLQAGNDWDDEELCTDIMGFWDGTSTGPFGLLIWGEPADPRNWEVTEGFKRKWQWTLQGCVELKWSTNYWRAKRGEKPLFSMGSISAQQQRSLHERSHVSSGYNVLSGVHIH